MLLKRNTVSGYSETALQNTKQTVEHMRRVYKEQNFVADADIIAYRGFGDGVFDKTFHTNPAALVGTTFSDAGYISTSVSSGSSFSRDWVATIHIPKGTPGAYIDSISDFQGEKEFLLASGTKFKVIEARHDINKGRTYLTLEVVQ